MGGGDGVSLRLEVPEVRGNLVDSSVAAAGVPEVRCEMRKFFTIRQTIVLLLVVVLSCCLGFVIEKEKNRRFERIEDGALRTGIRLGRIEQILYGMSLQLGDIQSSVTSLSLPPPPRVIEYGQLKGGKK